MVQRKTYGMGCNHPRHLCGLAHRRHLRPGRVSRQQWGKLNDCQNADLTATHIMPMAVEIAGSWNQQATDAIEDIGRCISVITVSISNT